jgi:hypothetical protein
MTKFTTDAASYPMRTSILLGFTNTAKIPALVLPPADRLSLANWHLAEVAK